MSLIIRPSTLQDVRELSKVIRQKDQEEAIAMGAIPHKAVFYSFKHGLYRKTAIINGKIAAMWGVAGTPLGMVGTPYLITSEQVKKLSPIKFARIYRQEVETMLKIFPVLENYVDANYKTAVRMLQIAGFDVDPPEEKFKGTFQRFHLETD